jgi:hypothetical protein
VSREIGARSRVIRATLSILADCRSPRRLPLQDTFEAAVR